MDMIIDRLSEIEHTAARIVNAAALEKKDLEAESKERIKTYDTQIDQDTQNKLKALKKTLDAQMNQELSQLKKDTENTMTMIENEYEAHHGKLADEILKRMITR